MSIEIRVYPVRDTGVFYGGDEVRGTVEARGPLDFHYHKDSKVNLIFTGSSETAHVPNGGKFYEDKAIFFQVENVLLDGIVAIKRGDSQTWQFSFMLPELTESSLGQAKIKRKKRYETFLMTPHPLPPSAALTGQTPHPWQGTISYTLHARVSGKWGWREDKRVLIVVPKPESESPSVELAVQSKPFTHSSSRLLPEEAERKRSVNKWFRDKVASNTPTAVFNIKAQTLQVLTPGQHIPIHVLLDYDTEKSNLSSVPEFRLLDMRYAIVAKTQVWGDAFMAGAMRELAGRFAAKDRVYERYLEFDSHFLVNGQKIEVDQYKLDDGILREVMLDRALVPSFRTYNLSRSYEIELSFSFDCGGKKCKAKFSWPLDIVVNERYIPPTQLMSSNEDKEAVQAVGKMVLKGVVTLVTAVLS